MRFAAALALLMLASCSGGVDAEAARTQVEQLIKAYHDAYDRADADAVVAMLDPEIAISRPNEGRFLYGRDACVDQLRKDMDRLKEKGQAGKRTTYFGTIQVEIVGPLAVATYATLTNEDKGPSGLFTRVFRLDAGSKRWLIYREHY